MFWLIAGGPLASFILGIISILIPLFFAGSIETPAVNFTLYALFTIGFISLIEDPEKESYTLLEGTVFTEKTFIRAAYRRDSETAKPFLEKGKIGYVEDQTIARAESAFLIANTEIDRGMARAKQGLGHSLSFKNLSPKGNSEF